MSPEEKKWIAGYFFFPAGHLVFSNEDAVLEIKRILEENLTREKAIRGWRRQNRTATSR